MWWPTADNKRPMLIDIDEEVNQVWKNKSIQPPQQWQQGRSAHGHTRHGPTTTSTPETLQALTEKVLSTAVHAMKEF
jgi:hypothetical protein